jgi:hypothetical protein
LTATYRPDKVFISRMIGHACASKVHVIIRHWTQSNKNFFIQHHAKVNESPTWDNHVEWLYKNIKKCVYNPYCYENDNGTFKLQIKVPKEQFPFLYGIYLSEDRVESVNMLRYALESIFPAFKFEIGYGSHNNERYKYMIYLITIIDRVEYNINDIIDKLKQSRPKYATFDEYSESLKAELDERLPNPYAYNYDGTMTIRRYRDQYPEIFDGADLNGLTCQMYKKLNTMAEQLFPDLKVSIRYEYGEPDYMSFSFAAAK